MEYHTLILGIIIGLSMVVHAQEEFEEYDDESRLSRNLPVANFPLVEPELSDISEGFQRLVRAYPGKTSRSSYYNSVFMRGRCRPSQGGSLKCKKKSYLYGSTGGK